MGNTNINYFNAQQLLFNQTKSQSKKTTNDVVKKIPNPTRTAGGFNSTSFPSVVSVFNSLGVDQLWIGTTWLMILTKIANLIMISHNP